MIVYFELSSVAADLGIPLTELYSVSNSINKHYKRVDVPKKSGGYRTLHVPDNRLKNIQRRINERILSKVSVSQYATAYRYNSSVVNNAVPHVGKPVVLKLDISGFFDSILYSQVKELVFPKEYFSESVRILLSLLCYYKDSLPQGAPTSPAVSNIIMREFDEDVGHWCKRQNITYTRYCDDMTFSGDFNTEALTRYVSERLRKMGFFLNEKKTIAVKNSERQLVTGIVVNEKTSVPSESRRKLRQEIHFCQKFGITEHIKRSGITDDPRTYIMRLIGRAEYFHSVSPDNAEFVSYKNWLTEQLKQHK